MSKAGSNLINKKTKKEQLRQTILKKSGRYNFIFCMSEFIKISDFINYFGAIYLFAFS